MLILDFPVSVLDRFSRVFDHQVAQSLLTTRL